MKEANHFIKKDLHQLIKKSKVHQLTDYQSKSVVLVFGKRYETMEKELNLHINNTTCNFKQFVKNLGVELGTNLGFKFHTTQCIQKVYARLKLLYAYRHLLNQASNVKLCDSLVLSHSNYCEVPYGS